MRSRLAVIVGGAVGVSLVSLICGIIITIMVIVPVTGSRFGATSVTPTLRVGPSIGGTTPLASATPPVRLIFPTPVPTEPSPTRTMPVATPTRRASVTLTPSRPATLAPSPTPTPRFPFYYKEGSRIEEFQCGKPYLKGWVKDATGDPLDGVVIRFDYWGRTDYAISGNREKYWEAGEWKFDYGQGAKGFDAFLATDLVLLVVASEGDPQPRSEALVIHYTGCDDMGQITNIVFKKR